MLLILVLLNTVFPLVLEILTQVTFMVFIRNLYSRVLVRVLPMNLSKDETPLQKHHSKTISVNDKKKKL